MGDLVAHLDGDDTQPEYSQPPCSLDYVVAAGLRTTAFLGDEVYHVLQSSHSRTGEEDLQIISEKSLFKGPLCVEDDYLMMEVDGIKLPVMVGIMRFSNGTWQYSFDGGYVYVDEQKLKKLGAKYWPNCRALETKLLDTDGE